MTQITASSHIATAGDAAQDAADCTPSNSDCAQNAPWQRRMHARSAFLPSSLTASAAAAGAAPSKPTVSLSSLPKFGVFLAANTIPVPSRQTLCQIDVVGWFIIDAAKTVANASV